MSGPLVSLFSVLSLPRWRFGLGLIFSWTLMAQLVAVFCCFYTLIYLFICLANNIINSLSVGPDLTLLYLVELLAWCLGLDKRCITITGRVVENSAGFFSDGLPGLSLISAPPH